MRPWRRKPIPGQSRPDGFHLERIPVHEDDPAGPAAALVYDGPLPACDGNLDHLEKQLAALRQMLASLGHQLDEVTQDRNRLAALSRRRAETIVTMRGQLQRAARVLASYGADPALIRTLTPPEEAVEAAVIRSPRT